MHRATPWQPVCGCFLHRRRFVAGALGGAAFGAARPAASAPPIAECARSGFTKAVPAETVENAAGQQYRQMLASANSQRALAPPDHAQLRRLRYIAQRIIPFAAECNPRAQAWRWEVNLIGSRQINAFCMPGGKIAFFVGILAELQLSDDEVAMVMGHEMAHALLEHAREQMGKNFLTANGLRLGAALLGLGNVGDLVAQGGAQLLSLKFSRDDESEADALGLLMGARAGYDPRSGATLWEKMMSGARGGAPPQILSTHPAGPTRIKDIQARLPRTLPSYEAAPKPEQRFGPPPRR